MSELDLDGWFLSEPCIVEWRVLNVLALVIATPIIIFGIIKDVKDWKSKQDNKTEKCACKLDCFARIAPWLLIFILFINLITMFIMVWSLLPESFGCQMYMRLFFWGVHLSVIGLYSLTIFRSHVAYSGSIFEYPKWFMLLLCFCILFITITSFVWDLTSIEHFEIYQKLGNELNYFCVPGANVPALYIAACVQAVMNTIACCIFIRPLLKLNDTRPHANLEGLIIRSTTLLSIALFSTTICLCVLTFYSGLEMRIIDATINLICVLLLQASMKPYFDIFCGQKGHCCCCKYSTNKMIEILDKRSSIRSSIYQANLEIASPAAPVSTP